MEKKLNILVFGQLEEFTGSSVISVDSVPDTEMLLQKLFFHYPVLKEKIFLIALDQKIITKKTEISEHTKIALLPPFSGG